VLKVGRKIWTACRLWFAAGPGGVVVLGELRIKAHEAFEGERLLSVFWRRIYLATELGNRGLVTVVGDRVKPYRMGLTFMFWPI
jgi:hypothetical protein